MGPMRCRNFASLVSYLPGDNYLAHELRVHTMRRKMGPMRFELTTTGSLKLLYQ